MDTLQLIFAITVGSVVGIAVLALAAMMVMIAVRMAVGC